MVVLQATRGPSRGGILKIPKHVALAFGRRTLSRCRKFGKSGVSCFNVAPLRDILFAPHENEFESAASVGGSVANTGTKYIGFQNPHPDSRISSDGPISNRGKKKELLLDDVGAVFGGTTGTRAYQGERKIKAKPKQNAGQIVTSGNGCINQSTRSLHPVQPSLNGSNHKRDVRMVPNSNGPQEMFKDGMEFVDPLNDLDPIDELGVGGPQDLSSLLNFDEDELQDHFSAGLDIPMDDLTELNMF
ncbi:hypothetical protein L1987_25237 [Smallanthus sonchifolius]|uniref:Uncharacterized protein n=1 Tax=Smallanthus sonchifolius TaxID=185202 RepID=A0ACB9IP64_9ASTR|nr:hypothetical protein L1987_25237 [Smallanthus sonchifolius]